MGIGVNVSCSCFGSFPMRVGPRIAPPKYSLFPFLCTDCKGVSTLDVYAETLACAHCDSPAVVPYGRPPAVGKLGDGIVFACSPTDRFSADDLTLTDGTYWCPTCRNYSARFSDSGVLWD